MNSRQLMQFIALIRSSLPVLSLQDVQWWNQHREELKQCLAPLHRSAQQSHSADRSPFPIWKTILLGTGPKHANDFYQVITKEGKRVEVFVMRILGRKGVVIADELTHVKLVNVSAAEMGMTGTITFKDFCDRAAQYGLKLCPAEVGPQLFLQLQYFDQLPDEQVIVAMHPIEDHEGTPFFFSVERQSSGSALLVYCVSPDIIDVNLRWALMVE
jgi:hypothetical protein